MIAALRANLLRGSKRSNTLLSYRLKSSTAFSFTPTAEYSDQVSADSGAEIPYPPTFKSNSEIYKAIVKPEDVADLFFEPRFEDVLITALAKDCPLSGSSTYKVTSKSPVDSSKLMFANIVIEWMKTFGSKINKLAPLPQSGEPLTFTSLFKTKALEAVYNERIFENQGTLESFCQEFAGTDISLENLASFLIRKCKSAANYEMIMKYLSNNVEQLNPMSVDDLVIMLMEDLSKDMSMEKVSHFDTFFTEYLTPLHPKLLFNVDVATLDRLAYISAFSSNILASTQILSILVTSHRVAPSKSTFDLYIARYAKHAISQNLSKENILTDLSSLKPLLFHFELSPKTVDFLVKKVIDNSFDLSNLCKLLVKLSPAAMKECSHSIMEKLHQIHNQLPQSELLKAVECMQLEKLLAEADALHK